MERKKLLAALLALVLLLSACSAGAVSESTGARTTSGDGAVTSREGLTFPIGAEVPFNGKGYLAPMIANEDVYNFPQTNNITFEPGARSDWHTHGGMVILVTGGVGYYQEEGKPAQIIRQGNVLEIGPGIKHWHGGSADTAFAHIAANTNPERPGVEWFDRISEVEYSQLGADGFTDIPEGAYYAEAANWCREQGILTGTAFNGNTPMTRATVADALYRAAGSPAAASASFSDIPAGSAYANAASWASANGVMSGYGNGTFGANDPVTRQQMAAVLWRYAGSPAAGAGEDFADESAIASYAKTAVDWARAGGVINGKEGNRFDPTGPLTRAQTAAILYRYLNQDQTAAPAENGDDPKVYMTTDISPEGLMAVYKALNWTPTGKVAVKLSTGEPPASNYLRPELIKDVVQEVKGTIVECNTAYGGQRSSTAMHYQVAKDHGFNDIADVVILDENGSMSLPVSGGTNLQENLVGQHFGEYDSYLVLSHFKGHAMAGYGGAIKNISIGLGSQEGKCLIHTGGQSHTSPWGGDQTAFTESMAEAGKSVSDYLGNGERIVYVNVMNRLSIDCDCDGNPAEPDLHDIGILASTDPVALDQACIDLVYAQKDGDGASLVNRIESRNGLHTLEHAEEIGLGSRSYQLISID